MLSSNGSSFELICSDRCDKSFLLNLGFWLNSSTSGAMVSMVRLEAEFDLDSGVPIAEGAVAEDTGIEVANSSFFFFGRGESEAGVDRVVGAGDDGITYELASDLDSLEDTRRAKSIMSSKLVSMAEEEVGGGEGVVARSGMGSATSRLLCEESRKEFADGDFIIFFLLSRREAASKGMPFGLDLEEWRASEGFSSEGLELECTGGMVTTSPGERPRFNASAICKISESDKMRSWHIFIAWLD